MARELTEQELQEFCSQLEIGHTIPATASQYDMTGRDCLELPWEQQRSMEIAVNKYIFTVETDILNKIANNEINISTWNRFNELAIRLPEGWGRPRTPRGSESRTPSANSNPALTPATDFFDIDDSGADALGV